MRTVVIADGARAETFLRRASRMAYSRSAQYQLGVRHQRHTDGLKAFARAMDVMNEGSSSVEHARELHCHKCLSLGIYDSH